MTMQKNRPIEELPGSTAGKKAHFLKSHTREEAERGSIARYQIGASVISFMGSYLWVCWKAEQLKDGRISKATE